MKATRLTKSTTDAGLQSFKDLQALQLLNILNFLTIWRFLSRRLMTLVLL